MGAAVPGLHGPRMIGNRTAVNGSRVRTAAVSGVIACGVVFAGACGFGLAAAFAEPASGDSTGSGDGTPAADMRESPPRTEIGTAGGKDLDERPGPGQEPGGAGGDPEEPAGSEPEVAGTDEPEVDEATDPEPPQPVGADPEELDAPAPAAAGQNCDDKDDDCGPPVPDLWEWLFGWLNAGPPGGSPGAGGGGGGGGGPSLALPPVSGPPKAAEQAPTGMPDELDELPEVRVGADDAGAPAGLGGPTAPAAPFAAVPVPGPPVGSPPEGAPPPAGPAITGHVPAVPAVPRPTPDERPASAAPEAVPTFVPDGFRAGYATYLRSASIGEVAGLAALGVSGLAAATAVGGLIGFRQAKAGLAVRAAGTARFL